MPTPFIAFTAPDPSRAWSPEALAVGFGLGGGLGAILALSTVAAEALTGAPVATLLTSPSVWMSCAWPVLLAAVGAYGTHVLAAHRSAYDAVAEKAGSLMDESWELQSALESLLDEPPTEVINQQPQPRTPTPMPPPVAGPQPAAPVLVQIPAPAESRDPVEAAEDAALIAAQTAILDRFAEASHDATSRMQVNLRGLAVTPMSLVQRRLVDALHAHVDGLAGLTKDVRAYTSDEPIHLAQAQPTSGRARRHAVA